MTENDLVVTIWSHTAGDNVLTAGPFPSLAAACTAAAHMATGLSDDQCLLLTGLDEVGYGFDAYELEGTETASSIRHEIRADDEAYSSLCRSEATWMAGSAFGNQGLADLGGLDLGGEDYADVCEGHQGCRCSHCC